VKLLLASYFGGVGHQLAWLPGVAVDGWHIDLASDGGQLDAVIAALDPAQTLSAGIIDGRNVWRADLDRCLHLLQPAHRQLGSRLWLAPGCSLLHCPVDLAGETQLPSNVRARLAFAAQKLVELKALARVLDGGDEGTVFAGSRRARQVAEQDRAICNPAVRARVAALGDGDAERDTPAPERARLQQEALQLPPFPTTTIGSFPQTPAIRQLRAEFRADRIGERDYVRGMRDEIAHCIREQEALDLDVLVHGEAERGDMVEYFGEQLAGFVFTANGWVQSYGSRCVKPPIIAGDVSRPLPITVAWTRYAQSLTERPVKGMLTGPVTILKWSFVRGDLPRRDVALQIALALRDEVSDLENAGIRIIQLDEPAFREALPLRREDRDHYLDWAVRAFRVAAGAARATTQIHSHMCYSEFDTVGEAIAALDVDVLTVETSRSESNVLKVFCHCETPHAVGPGAYDIHSPLVPRADEIEQRMRDALQWLPAHRLWVNPDCGLKTRQWPETIAALAAMVDAAKRLRESLGATTAPAPASDCPRSPAPPPPTRGTATAAR
jgi:5-methyltetrahydropteroyltriglutamate--homocysteine methyltransferase